MGERYEVGGRNIEIRCPVCGEWLPLLRTRKGKPYAVCEGCGAQLFVRYPMGIERIKRVVDIYPKADNIRYEDRNVEES